MRNVMANAARDSFVAPRSIQQGHYGKWNANVTLNQPLSMRLALLI